MIRYSPLKPEALDEPRSIQLGDCAPSPYLTASQRPSDDDCFTVTMHYWADSRSDATESNNVCGI